MSDLSSERAADEPSGCRWRSGDVRATSERLDHWLRERRKLPGCMDAPQPCRRQDRFRRSTAESATGEEE